MAISPFAQRALRNVGNDGFARAKKLADLAIKTNTDSSGKVTAAGYEQAMSILQPYITSGNELQSIDAQRLVAGYNNSLTKINKGARDQNETVGAFKIQENDAYFTSFDGDVGTFRNPANLVDSTSEALDSLLIGVINAIDEKEANGESTDALYNYMLELQKRADTMRDVSNRFQRGELTEGQTLDGFGYFVDTNPLDGSIRGAAFLPVNLAPTDVTAGYKRLQATTALGSAKLPVYAPAITNDMGESVARIGDAVWSGTGSGALQNDSAVASKNLFVDGGFDISDRALYGVQKNTVQSGSFARALVGRDEEGNAVDAIFYRGVDNKLYQVDQATLDTFRADPMLKSKLDGYVPRLSPTEAREISKEAVPFTQDKVASEARGIKIGQYNAEQVAFDAKAKEANSFFGMAKATGADLMEKASAAAPTAVLNTVNPVAGFFSRVNRQNKPDAPAASTTGDVVEQGKNFFRQTAENVGSFFNK